jgi:transposase
MAFLGGDGDERSRWRGTLVRDEYKAYDSVIGAGPERIAAGCHAHARRKFDELLRDGGRSAVATEALQRIAQIYRIERELAGLTAEARLDSRQAITKPMWEQLHVGYSWNASRCQMAAPRPRL